MIGGFEGSPVGVGVIGSVDPDVLYKGCANNQIRGLGCYRLGAAFCSMIEDNRLKHWAAVSLPVPSPGELPGGSSPKVSTKNDFNESARFPSINDQLGVDRDASNG